MVANLVLDVCWHVARGLVGATVQADTHILQRVANATTEKIATQSTLETDLSSQVSFSVNVIGAQKGIVTIEQIVAELEFAPQEPRLDESQLIILALRAHSCPQPELLAAAAKPGRLKIPFIVFGNTDQRVHGAKARGQRHVTRGLFIHVNN